MGSSIFKPTKSNMHNLHLLSNSMIDFKMTKTVRVILAVESIGKVSYMRPTVVFHPYEFF